MYWVDNSGDTPEDVRAGRAAGVATVGVTWGFATPGAVAAAGPDELVGTVAELAAVLHRPT